MNWLLSKPLRPLVVLAASASLLLNLALLVPSLYMLQVFDRVFASRSVETLVMLGLFTLLALGLALAMDRARALLLARAGRSVDEALSAAALAAGIEDRAGGGADVDRTALPDIARLRHFLSTPAIQALFDAPWLPVYLAVIFALHPLLGVAALVSAAALFGLGWWTERTLREDAESVAGGGRRAGQWIDALHRNAEVLVGMRMVGTAVAAWRDVHAQVQQAQERLGNNGATLAALGRQLRQAVQVGMLGLGAWLVVDGNASPGIMIAATVLLARALQPVEQLIAGWKALLEVRSAWHRLQRRRIEPAIDSAVRLPELRGHLSLERVSLVVDIQRAPLIANLSLAVKPGECLGLVGPSAAGKTTLLRLMLGLCPPSAGTVRLDGVELAHWPVAQLAGAIGYLPQDVELFAGTVASNIARLGPVDAGRLIEAARLAGVHELVARLPQAYETELGEAGARLSGGQRQRIGLARALYGAPRLVLLDEPNAHLDAEGEEALAAALAGLKRMGSTVVMVSHRPALMRHADTLAVLRGGALELVGPREQVLARLSGATVHPLRREPTPAVQGAQA